MAGLEPAMTSTQRFFLRLRERAVRGYELLLYAFLLALMFSVPLAASPAAGEEPAHCGNAHSSSGVYTR
jgi:hypothetical protein